MKKAVFLVPTIAVLLLATTVIAKDRPQGRPFQAIWDAITNSGAGSQGPPGPAGECDCDISREEFDTLKERVTALEQAQECISGETRDCYTGSQGTEDVGLCHGGTEECIDFHWSDVCKDEVIPVVEDCDGLDNDCDGEIDEELTRSCYTGPQETEDVGECKSGTETCEAEEWGECVDEVTPTTEVCDDDLDNDCDNDTDCTDVDCESDPTCI